jgi:hypothetical protein
MTSAPTLGEQFDSATQRIERLEALLIEVVEASRKQLALMGKGVEPSQRLADAWAKAEQEVQF